MAPGARSRTLRGYVGVCWPPTSNGERSEAMLPISTAGLATLLKGLGILAGLLLAAGSIYVLANGSRPDTQTNLSRRDTPTPAATSTPRPEGTPTPVAAVAAPLGTLPSSFTCPQGW